MAIELARSWLCNRKALFHSRDERGLKALVIRMMNQRKIKRDAKGTILMNRLVVAIRISV